MSLSDVTCLVPLYRSVPLLDHVFGNIEEHLAAGASVICSDEHCLDDAATRIRERFDGSDRLRVIDDVSGNGNWITNCNRLIEATQTSYFRIIPHDDSVSARDTALLVDSLRARSSIVVSHGRVLAETLEGHRLPERDEPRMPLRPIDAPLAFSAGFFWQGLFSGSFKAVIRRNVWRGGPLFIRSTPSLKHSERTWLFALSLLGDFSFSEGATMTKRYWAGSLTDEWRPEARHLVDAADVMASYVEDLVDGAATRAELRKNLYLNAMRRANWLDGLTVSRPDFEPPDLSGLVDQDQRGST